MILNTWSKGIWKWLDRLLITAVFVLLAWLVFLRFSQGKAVARSDGPAERAPAPKAAEPAPVRTAPRPVPSAQPVRFSDAAGRTQSQWRERGVRDVEWESLPPSPGLDMVQTDQGYVVALSLPGVRDEDIRIDCLNGSLDIRAVVRESGSRNAPNEACRRIRLPVDSVSDSELRRSFSNGVLRVFIPRTAQP